MPRFSNRPFLATTLSFLSSRGADLPAASQEWNERVDIEPLPTHERLCFVSGHDFSRAAQQPSTMGFSPCSYLEHILFIRSEAEGPAVRHSCAPLLPACNRPTSPNPHGNTNLPLSFRVSRSGPRNRRSLGFAPPDFLLRLVALANFMRLSLRERRTRNRVQRKCL
jgi:hypothetical protein